MDNEIKINDDITRYTGVIPVTEFDNIEQMILNRDWKIHFSWNEVQELFFASELSSNEIEYFNQFFQPYYNVYLAKNEYQGMVIKKAYINCYPAHHPGGWHEDAPQGFTALYFPFSFINFRDEAGTEFKDLGIAPYQNNTLTLFPQSLTHRGCIHTQIGKFKYSIAFKFLNPDFIDY
jgi:hypothetical protein